MTILAKGVRRVIHSRLQGALPAPYRTKVASGGSGVSISPGSPSYRNCAYDYARKAARRFYLHLSAGPLLFVSALQNSKRG
jgi:hypothetical protein